MIWYILSSDIGKKVDLIFLSDFPRSGVYFKFLFHKIRLNLIKIGVPIGYKKVPAGCLGVGFEDSLSDI